MVPSEFHVTASLLVGRAVLHATHDALWSLLVYVQLGHTHNARENGRRENGMHAASISSPRQPFGQTSSDKELAYSGNMATTHRRAINHTTSARPPADRGEAPRERAMSLVPRMIARLTARSRRSYGFTLFFPAGLASELSGTPQRPREARGGNLFTRANCQVAFRQRTVRRTGTPLLVVSKVTCNSCPTISYERVRDCPTSPIAIAALR